MSAENTEQSLSDGLPLPLAAMVESLLFVSSEPAPIGRIAEALEVSVDQIEEALAELKESSSNGAARGLRIQRRGDKVQLTTRPECAPYVEKFLGLALTSRLSKPALETLAIVAYQQPITRPEIEMIRGVNCDGVIQTLLSKGLIEEVGRLETAGRPIQYGTTFSFLQHFGLRSLDELPALKAEEPAPPEPPAAEPAPTVQAEPEPSPATRVAEAPLQQAVMIEIAGTAPGLQPAAAEAASSADRKPEFPAPTS